MSIPTYEEIMLPLLKLISDGKTYSNKYCEEKLAKEIGLNGREFKMYKFRSMVVNAEELKDKLKENNEMSGPMFKMKDDPRITKIGVFGKYKSEQCGT